MSVILIKAPSPLERSMALKVISLRSKLVLLGSSAPDWHVVALQANNAYEDLVMEAGNDGRAHQILEHVGQGR